MREEDGRDEGSLTRFGVVSEHKVQERDPTNSNHNKKLREKFKEKERQKLGIDEDEACSVMLLSNFLWFLLFFLCILIFFKHISQIYVQYFLFFFVYLFSKSCFFFFFF